MSVGGVSNNGVSNSPGVRMAQIQGSALASLWGGASGRPSDLNSFTSAAVAMPLYQHAGLLTGLTQWDGGMTPGSQRTAPAAPTAPAKPPVFTFNPFDRASWWSAPKGSKVDTKA